MNVLHRYTKIAVALTGLVLVVLLLSDRFKIMVVPTAIGCLPIKIAIVDKHNTTPRHDQLVTFSVRNAEPYFADHTSFIKLAAGLPGDSVTIYVDKVIVERPSTGITKTFEVNALPMLNYLKMDRKNIERAITIPKGYIFALGTTTTAYDSRYFGLVKTENIRGVGYAVM